MPPRPPRGSGNARLAIASLALSPLLIATYAQAAIVRQRFSKLATVQRAVDALGLHQRVREVHVIGSGKSNAVVAVTFGDGSRAVIKRSLPFGTLMAWGARHFGANFTYAADTSGTARIAREQAALEFLAARGVAVPRCLAASPDQGLLALAWIDGTPAATALHGSEGARRAAEVGALLRRVHDLGVTLADGHPGNMMIDRATDQLVLFDLEFAELAHSTPEHRGFDLAYAAVLMPTPVLREAMLAAYGELTAQERSALALAEKHIRRYSQLLELERARWRPAP